VFSLVISGMLRQTALKFLLPTDQHLYLLIVLLLSFLQVIEFLMGFVKSCLKLQCPAVNHCRGSLSVGVGLDCNI